MLDFSTIEARVSLARKYAQKYALDVELVCAMAEQESSWNPWAIRYEPAFYERYIVPLNIGSLTEGRARAFSWGLLQVMGQTAREYKYLGHLAELCDPDVGMDVGCAVFAAKLSLAGNDPRKALLSYNGGNNLAYPEQVLARAAKYASLPPSQAQPQTA